MKTLKNKKILIIKLSGSGKTFVSQSLSEQGTTAFDGDTVEGLSGWFDQSGKKALPENLSPEGLKGLDWNWNPEVLEALLKKHSEGILLFGISSNWHKFLNLFDKVFFLEIDSNEMRKRLLSEERKNPYGKDEETIQNIINHIDNFKQFALKHKAVPLDASNSPEEIYVQILKKS